MYTIAKLKNDLQGILRGTSTDKITNINEVFNRAARECVADNDFAETRRTEQLTNPIYDEVYDYSLPADVKGNKIVDVIKQVNRGEKISLIGAESFDFNKPNSTCYIKWNKGTKFLRINAEADKSAILHSCNSLTDNGTWAATADATNLTVDTLNYISGSSALNLDLSGASTSGYIENSTLTAVDLSDYEDVGSLFLWLYIPDTSLFTSVDLAWGSDSSNYWNVTATTPNFGSVLTGWNLFRFDWNGATETGSPDSSAVDYLKVTINYTGTAETDIRIDSIMAKLGSIYSLDYYSKYLFANSSGSWIEETEDDTDYLNLDTDSYNVYLNKVAELCFAQLSNKQDEALYYKQEYLNSSIKYRRMYKSEAKKPKETYYDLFKR